MFDIITTTETFGSWKDCYLYMKEFSLKSIYVIKTRYCLKDISGSNLLTFDEVKNLSKVSALEKLNARLSIELGKI